VKLTDGRVVLVWNNSPDARTPLTLAISEDEGDTWAATRDLTAGEGQFHYPAVVEGPEGQLHVTFTNNRITIDHVELSVDWIYGEGPNLRTWEGESTTRGTA
jgi:predicted neuraminidase